MQILFGVASAEDPVCKIVQDLVAAYPRIDAQLLNNIWTKCVRTQKFAFAPTPIPRRRFVGLISGSDQRQDHVLPLFLLQKEAGQVALAYKVYRAWVSEFQALPDLDANANAVAIQHIKLENEGWERDQSVPEPTEPTFTNPAN